MSTLEKDIKELIVEALMLEDVNPDEIDSEAPLFGEGLGLDSIDALELAIALDRRFKVKIRADDPNTRETFRSVKTLAAYVQKNQTEAR
jgi:acyl carrier protein